MWYPNEYYEVCVRMYVTRAYVYSLAHARVCLPSLTWYARKHYRVCAEYTLAKPLEPQSAFSIEYENSSTSRRS